MDSTQPVDSQQQTTATDGGSAPLTAQAHKKRTARLLEYVSCTDPRAGTSANYRNEVNALRFNQWAGANLKGTKGKPSSPNDTDFEGKAVSTDENTWPYPGAPDTRPHTADFAINFIVALCLAALEQGRPDVKGIEFSDSQLANACKKLLTWRLDGLLRRKFRGEVEKCLQWTHGDSPAGSVMQVTWQREYALDAHQVDGQEILSWLSEVNPEAAQDPEAIAQVVDLLMDPEQVEDAIAFLQSFIPGLKPKRARKMLKDLAATGRTSFPEQYLKINCPKIRALRLYHDIIIPPSTTDIQSAEEIFVRDTLTSAQAKARAHAENWSEEFKAQFFPQEMKSDTAAQGGVRGKSILLTGEQSPNAESTQDHQTLDLGNQYEIWTHYIRDVDEEGVPGIYTQTFHPNIDLSPGDRQLAEAEHGDYPFTYFPRENLTNTLQDGRGVCEVAGPAQTISKKITDAATANVELSVIPPYTYNMGRPALRNLKIAPLIGIPRRDSKDIDFLDMPPVPASAWEVLDRIERNEYAYFGLPHAQVPEAITGLIQQKIVNDFLNNLSVVFLQLLQLDFQYLDPQTLAQVTGLDNLPDLRQRETIQQMAHITMSYDVADVNPEAKAAKIDNMLSIIERTDRGTVHYDALQRHLIEQFDASLAQNVLIPGQAAAQKEIDDELTKLAMISAGIEPPLPGPNDNNEARLQALQNQFGANPQSIQDMDPLAFEMLQARLQALQHQIQQKQNAQIGRQGAQPVTGPQSANPPGAGGQPPTQTF